MIKYIKKIVAVVLLLVLGVVPSVLIIYKEGFLHYLFLLFIFSILYSLLIICIKLLQDD